MKFGPCPVDQAEGAVLAHSLDLGGRRLRKGRQLDAKDVAALAQAGIESVVVAQLDPQDVAEDEAARRIGAALAASHLRPSPAMTGRVNLIAEQAGVLSVDAAAVAALNRVGEAITLATLPPMARVEKDQLVATVKIIPYGVAAGELDQALAAISGSTLALHPFRPGRAGLILTRTPGLREALLRKGAETVAARLDALGLDRTPPRTVAHETDALARALAEAGTEDVDLLLVLGASATSDRGDVIPAAIVAAGGRVTRFGMPVDPGNLLVLGELGDRPVVGLPGCAKSPALNGADWVLERLAAGIRPTSDDIAEMAVGGLLKEIPDRPHPRRSR